MMASLGIFRGVGKFGDAQFRDARNGKIENAPEPAFSIYYQQQTALKTLWEKKKLLVTSNFFFSQNDVFTQSENRIPICQCF